MISFLNLFSDFFPRLDTNHAMVLSMTIVLFFPHNHSVINKQQHFTSTFDRFNPNNTVAFLLRVGNVVIPIEPTNFSGNRQ